MDHHRKKKLEERARTWGVTPAPYHLSIRDEDIMDVDEEYAKPTGAFFSKTGFSLPSDSKSVHKIAEEIINNEIEFQETLKNNKLYDFLHIVMGLANVPTMDALVTVDKEILLKKIESQLRADASPEQAELQQTLKTIEDISSLITTIERVVYEASKTIKDTMTYFENKEEKLEEYAERSFIADYAVLKSLYKLRKQQHNLEAFRTGRKKEPKTLHGPAPRSLIAVGEVNIGEENELYRNALERYTPVAPDGRLSDFDKKCLLYLVDIKEDPDIFREVGAAKWREFERDIDNLLNTENPILGTEDPRSIGLAQKTMEIIIKLVHFFNRKLTLLKKNIEDHAKEALIECLDDEIIQVTTGFTAENLASDEFTESEITFDSLRYPIRKAIHVATAYSDLTNRIRASPETSKELIRLRDDMDGIARSVGEDSKTAIGVLPIIESPIRSKFLGLYKKKRGMRRFERGEMREEREEGEEEEEEEEEEEDEEMEGRGDGGEVTAVYLGKPKLHQVVNSYAANAMKCFIRLKLQFGTIFKEMEDNVDTIRTYMERLTTERVSQITEQLKSVSNVKEQAEDAFRKLTAPGSGMVVSTPAANAAINSALNALKMREEFEGATAESFYESDIAKISFAELVASYILIPQIMGPRRWPTQVQAKMTGIFKNQSLASMLSYRYDKASRKIVKKR